jgi:hypothetical protein
VEGMSDRYVTATYVKHFGYYETALTADFVFEQERQAVKTGLLDANGTPLYRIHETLPVGFDLSQRAKT